MHCNDGLQFYNFINNLSPVYMSDIYALNTSPVVKTRISVDSFLEPIYMKAIAYFKPFLTNYFLLDLIFDCNFNVF